MNEQHLFPQQPQTEEELFQLSLCSVILTAEFTLMLVHYCGFLEHLLG